MRTDFSKAPENGRLPRYPYLLAAFAGVCLLVSLGQYFAGNLGNLVTTMLLFPAACAFAGAALYCRALPRCAESRVLYALLALVFIVSALNEKFYGVFTENAKYLGTLTVSIFVCYAFGFALPRERRMRALHICIDVCAAVVALMCLWGLALAASGVYYMPRFSPEYGIGLCPQNVGMGADFRLVVFTHPNTVGMVCEIVLLLCVYRAICCKRALSRALYAVAALICFVAASAASSRTSSLAISAGLAMIVFRLLYLWLRNRKCAVRIGAAIAAAVAVAVVCFALTDALYNGMLSLSPVGRSEIAAVTDAERVVADETGAFSGRTSIWLGVLRCMRDTPRLFALGASPVAVGHVIADYTPIWVQEVHSSFVQMLISGGALCPILFIAFVAMLCVRGARLYFAVPRAGEPDAGWLVPPLAAILISACMETFLLLYPRLHFANLWFFLLAGLVIAFDLERKQGASTR